MAQQGNNGQAVVNNVPCRNLARICRAVAGQAAVMRGMAFANLRENERLHRRLALMDGRDARLNGPPIDLRAVRQQGLAAAAAPPDRPRGALTLAVGDELRLKLKVLGNDLEKCEAGLAEGRAISLFSPASA